MASEQTIKNIRESIWSAIDKSPWRGPSVLIISEEIYAKLLDHYSRYLPPGQYPLDRFMGSEVRVSWELPHNQFVLCPQGGEHAALQFGVPVDDAHLLAALSTPPSDEKP